MTYAPKIFGIGLQRTGTTSLYEALSILGYRAVHGPFGLYPDLDRTVLERYDAFMDNPVPLLYKRLDEACPGSRFICTTRDIDSWLISVRWLFTVGRLESNWQADPVVVAVHKTLYGTDHFDEQAFRDTWHRYHAAVQEYFSGRLQDLLMLDFTQGDGWDRLCPFLEKERPPVDFPVRNEASFMRRLTAPVKYLIKRAIGWKLTDHPMTNR